VKQLLKTLLAKANFDWPKEAPAHTAGNRPLVALGAMLHMLPSSSYGQEPTQQDVLAASGAIKFTDKGEVAIEAKATGAAFELSVDTGPGISPENQQRIFDEFQQVDDSVTRQKGGTGLGLTISKRIVELHGGTICVDSKMGVGSTFIVTLPVHASDVRQAAE